MVSKTFMVESATSSSETVASGTFMHIIAETLNVFKQASIWSLKWGVPSQAFTESFEQCSTFTNQFISLTGRRFA